MGKIIGIDLGITNSAGALMEAGRPTVIANQDPKIGYPAHGSFGLDICPVPLG